VYRPQADDVPEDVDRAVFDGLRATTPPIRLRIAARASVALHRLSVAGLRLRDPDASEEELFRRAGTLRLGPEFTRRMLGAEADAWLDGPTRIRSRLSCSSRRRSAAEDRCSAR
jgi:hypothetical protein